MAAIRVERTAVKPFYLGHLGFDHLQLVYDHHGDGRSAQDDWYVIEGVRDPGPSGPTLGVQGSDGRLTLAQANAASGEALAGKLGTPQSRGSTVVSRGREARRLWPLLAHHAHEIESLQMPYIAYAPPGMRPRTCNSSTVIATLLDRVGFDIAAILPAGTRFVPGVETRIACRAFVIVQDKRLGWRRAPGHAKNQTSEDQSIGRGHAGRSPLDICTRVDRGFPGLR